MTDFDPLATTTAPRHHNKPPELVVFETIDSLYEEATNWADGEPVTTQEVHDEILRLDDMLKAAGTEADELRKKEKEPHDLAAQAVQDKYAPYISDTKKVQGKVTRARKALLKAMEPFRVAKARQQEEDARRAREASQRAMNLAKEEMQETSGNLLAREEAEENLSAAKWSERQANKMAREAGKGLGLRTVYRVEIANKDDALDWAFSKAPEKFHEMALTMAQEHVNATKSETVPGFKVTKDKVAR